MKCNTCDCLQAMLDQQKVYTENATRAAMEYKESLADARRQVDALAKKVADRGNCCIFVEDDNVDCKRDGKKCWECMREWAENEARKGANS